MALEDYYKKLNFVEYKRVPDGFGGWKGEWEVGAEFPGLITLASDTIQNTEALRGNLNKQYKLSGTKSIKFDEKAFKADHPKEYDKYSTESVTFRLSKTEGDEIDE